MPLVIGIGHHHHLLGTLNPVDGREDAGRRGGRINQSEADADTTKAQIQKCEGNLLLAKQQFERTEKLVAKGVVTKEEYDQRVAQRNSAQADLDGAKSRFSAADPGLLRRFASRNDDDP